MSHFLFIAGALRERSSKDSAERQLSAGLWGLCTELIRDNLQTFVAPNSQGLVYVLKEGICAGFRIVSSAQPYASLDDLMKDELRTEARFGFVRIGEVRRYGSSVAQSQRLLHAVLNISEQSELTRRLSLGMHRLTEDEYQALIRGLATVHADVQ